MSISESPLALGLMLIQDNIPGLSKEQFYLLTEFLLNKSTPNIQPEIIYLNEFMRDKLKLSMNIRLEIMDLLWGAAIKVYKDLYKHNGK